MATYVEFKINFDLLSKIEIFQNFSFRKLIFNRIINSGLWCYNWCWKHHSINVADFQQKCCFSATNYDSPALSTAMQLKIIIYMKKQHLLLKNNIFVENRQQCHHVASSISYIIKGTVKLIKSPTHIFMIFYWYFWRTIKNHENMGGWFYEFYSAFDVIIDAGSNMMSLLPILNKNVVFQQQMLFFHPNLDFYLNECTEH